ncbi:MAG: hypothetical protein LDL13_05375 [Calditerrivibrio sp.]|nr:hypothetical protein [Calditerrivibrio sp.]MCA1980821.1 hypothetical protein [Calditerrivibrio sp.]
MRKLKEVYNSSSFVELLCRYVEANYGIKINEYNSDCLLGVLYQYVINYPETEDEIEIFVRDNLKGCLFNNESFFFRNKDQIRYILSHFSKNSYLNILSFGCSEGQEPYSLSMALTEAGIKHRVYGVDIDVHAIDKARVAIYDHYDMRNLDDNYKKWFEIIDGKFYLSEIIKNNVEFYNLNILKNNISDAIKVNFDIILCNNVLIYGTKALISSVLEQFLSSLVYGGIIFTTFEESCHFENCTRLVKVSDKPILFKKLDISSLLEKDYKDLHMLNSKIENGVDYNVEDSEIKMIEKEIGENFDLDKVRRVVALLFNNGSFVEAKKWQYIILLTDKYTEDDFSLYLDLCLKTDEIEEYVTILKKKVDIFKDKKDMVNLIDAFQRIGNAGMYFYYSNLYKKLYGDE